MKYVRPENLTPISKERKKALLQNYFDFYQNLAKIDLEKLNVKISRASFSVLLNQIGCLLLQNSKDAASNPGPIQKFLDENPLPGELDQMLPKEFRAYCLGLNALKQWIAAEQAATDRYLLGSTARSQCREAATKCVISDQNFNTQAIELHHPVRDGRPPIPVSKEGHSKIEGQNGGDDSDPIMMALRVLRREGNRSWKMLRLGCESLLGKQVNASTPNVLASSKTFARKASEKSGLSYEELLEYLNESNL